MSRLVVPRGFAVVFACAIVALGSCRDWGKPQKAPEPAASIPAARIDFRSRGECPHDWPDTVPLVGPATNVPEYNDCQRFIRAGQNGSEEYAGVFAIWARKGLGELFTTTLPLATGVPSGTSAVPATTPVGAAPTTVVPPTSPLPAGRGATVAVIWTDDANGYGPLGVKQGWNCLALRPNASGSGFDAAIVPIGDFDSACDATIVFPDPAAQPLRVERITAVSLGLTAADVPAVARWDFDRRHQRYYVGLGCGPAWCEIYGTTALSSSEAYAVSGSSKERRVSRIKGWFDEQRLAEVGPGGALYPGTTVGSIVPDAELDSKTEADFKAAWVKSARIHLHTVSASYATKLNADQASKPNNPSRQNKVELCSGPLAADGACKLKPEELETLKNCTTTWYARIKGAGPSRVFCVTRHPFAAGLLVPGTARWRWRKDDESIWVRCGDACCEVEVDT